MDMAWARQWWQRLATRWRGAPCADAGTRSQGREQALLLAMQALGCGYWEWHLGTRQLRFEGEFFRQFGVYEQPAETVQAYWDSLRHPDDAAHLRPYIASARAGAVELFESECRIRDLNGQWHWVLSRGHVVERDTEGRPLRFAGMTQDVTQQRADKEILRASEAKSSAIYQMLPDPAGISRQSDGCYVDVNAAFCALLGRPRDAWLGRTSTEMGIWATPHERERLLQALQRDGHVTSLPLVARSGDRLVPGLMSAQPLKLDGEDCLVFVFHDMTQEQRTRDELLAVNGLLQQAGRLARLGAWEDAPEQGIVYWSDVCYEIHGLPKGAPLPRNYIDTYVAPPWRETMRAKFLECIRHGIDWNIVMQVVRADGEWVWVRARGEPVVENGRLARVRGVMQDIDEAKRAEEQLRQSEEHFARIFQLVDQPMGMVRRSDGRYQIVNPAWEALTGITQDEALGRNALELGLFAPGDRADMLAAMASNGQLSDYEITLTARDGTRRTVLQSLREVDYYGEPCWLFSAHDITERKRNEERVREREELLSLTVSAASLGLWDWDLHMGLISGDARWRAMTGRQASASHSWSAGLAPEDIERVQAEVQRHAGAPATPFDVTWRVALPQGGARWIRNMGKIVGHDAQGQPARMLGVSLDVTRQREQQEQLQRLAHFDALTGLPNRVQLAQRLQDTMEKARANGTQLGVAYLDLDGFKPVNDKLGHGAGDRLLVIVAARLTRALRPTDCVARLGGDEFVILLPDLKTREGCEQKLRQLMAHISAPYTLEAERVGITASIGYTLYPEDDADADTLLRHADQAMYQAKQNGRNRFHGFDAILARSQREQHIQIQRLGQALEHGEFTLYLQPQVDMDSGAVVGAECLVRWRHPQEGVLAPGAFLPALEGTELEIPFGEWVFAEALRCIATLRRQGLALPLGINIAARHLQQPGFARWILGCLDSHPDAPAALVKLEITESAALYDVEHVAAELAQLRAQGITVALDDFGTGYSSLTYLRRLPMDTLKIDQSFVRDMLVDPGDLAIVQGVIGLARSFGLGVIAEGVETAQQGQRLQQLGCPLAQGYYIARPMPLEDFVHWAAHWKLPAGWQAETPT